MSAFDRATSEIRELARGLALTLHSADRDGSKEDAALDALNLLRWRLDDLATELGFKVDFPDGALSPTDVEYVHAAGWLDRPEPLSVAAEKALLALPFRPDDPDIVQRARARVRAAHGVVGGPGEPDDPVAAGTEYRLREAERRALAEIARRKEKRRSGTQPGASRKAHQTATVVDLVERRIGRTKRRGGVL